jgi:hypothetical protein
MKALSTAISSGALENLQVFRFHDNDIGDAGLTAFAGAIGARGALGSLIKLALGGNRIGDKGMQAFSLAIAKGALGSLVELDISWNAIGDAGLISFAEAIRSGALAAFKKVVVPSGLEDHPALVAACKPRGIEIA